MKKPAPVTRKPPQEIIEGPFEDAGLLPSRVAAMRDRILEACASGDIDRLRPAIERNEVMPLFGKAGDRPKNFAVAIEFLRQLSFDGKGREILLLLDAVLSSPFAKVVRGPHVSYIWPAFAIIAPKDISEDMRLAMMRCIAFADLQRIQTGGTMPFQRVEIGEDGTWHAFGLS